VRGAEIERVSVGVLSGQQQALYSAAARYAVTQQPRRKNARVIGCQDVARSEKTGQFANACVRHVARLSLQHEQPRLAAGEGFLRHQLFREIEIEI
jgi:hypothetical protein